MDNITNVVLPPKLDGILENRDSITMEIRIGDFLTDEFFTNYTKFTSYGEFVHFSPFSDDDLANDPNIFYNDEMSRYIELTTNFNNFKEMMSFAIESKLWNNQDGDNIE